MPLTQILAPILLGAGLVCVAGTAVPAPAHAQASRRATVTVQGSVVDSAGTPIVDAEVLILGAPRVVTTSARGEFTLDGLPRDPAVLRVRRMGYRARSVILEPGADTDTLTLLVELETLALELSPVIVRAMEEKYSAKMEGFADRMKHAPRSSFITRADIEKRSPLRTSDLLDPLQTVRCRGRSGALYLDGAYVRGFDINWLNPNDIEAIEYYRGAGQIPIRFNATLPQGNTPGCVVVIWTR
jgi:hypothetical protein